MHFVLCNSMTVVRRGQEFSNTLNKRSCLSKLLDTFQSWAKARNESHKVNVILLDLTKAVDSVPHKRLLVKLKGYDLVETYLSG